MNPPKLSHAPNSTAEMQAYAEKLDTLAKSVTDNEIRLHRVEKSVQMFRGRHEKVRG